MPICDSPVLILEQSPIVVKQLVHYLTKLRFKRIFSFNEIDAALEKFADLIKEKQEPIVFLAFDHPDTNAISILPRFYQISTNTKVIIETARSRNDECVRQLISMGVFYFISKPFYFKDIEQIISTIQNDADLMQDFIEKDKEFVCKILDGLQRISITRLAEITKLNKDKIITILDLLIKENRIRRMGIINEVMCGSCSSVQILPIFFCKSCMSSNFTKQRLIEHYKCGAVRPEDDYPDDMCPNCKKKITTLGLDYRVTCVYSCLDCSDKFQYPEFSALCLMCGTKSTLEELKWIKSQSIISLTATNDDATIDNFENVLEKEFGTLNTDEVSKQTPII